MHWAEHHGCCASSTQSPRYHCRTFLGPPVGSTATKYLKKVELGPGRPSGKEDFPVPERSGVRLRGWKQFGFKRLRYLVSRATKRWSEVGTDSDSGIEVTMCCSHNNRNINALIQSLLCTQSLACAACTCWHPLGVAMSPSLSAMPPRLPSLLSSHPSVLSALMVGGERNEKNKINKYNINIKKFPKRFVH